VSVARDPLFSRRGGHALAQARVKGVAMTKLAKWCGLAACTLSISACGGGRDADEAQDQNQTASPVEAVGSTGTGQSTITDEAAPTRPDALPGTASPLPLVGGIGALLVGTSMALRFYRRRLGRTNRS
jgi:hypothetical protein